MRSAPSPIDHAALRAFAALLRRWFGFVLACVAGMRARSEPLAPETLRRAERRLKKLLLARAIAQLGPRRRRTDARHQCAPTGFRRIRRDGGDVRQLTRGILPKLRRATPQACLARLQHVFAHLDIFVARLIKRLARARPATRLIAIAAPALTLIANTQAFAVGAVDTS